MYRLAYVIKVHMFICLSHYLNVMNLGLSKSVDESVSIDIDRIYTVRYSVSYFQKYRYSIPSILIISSIMFGTVLTDTNQYDSKFQYHPVRYRYGTDMIIKIRYIQYKTTKQN